MCHLGFQKYGLCNRIFGLKQESWEQIFAKICALGNEI